MSQIKTNTIAEAIEEIKNGKIIIVVDDADRENEGDFVVAAEKVTPETINFMATYGRGLICVPLTEKRCEQLNLNPMVQNNTDSMETAFTVSVDAKGDKMETGISANDRAMTIKALADRSTKPSDLSRPGHVFPLIAKDGGVLRRTGHTEAAIDLARLAGLKPAGVVVEIMNEDGTMARMPQLIEVAKKFDLKIITIEDLIAYRMQHDSLIVKKEETTIKTAYGEYKLHAFQQTNNQQVHIALTKGNWDKDEVILTRINTKQVYQDILAMLTGDTENFLKKPFEMIEKEGRGAVLFVNQEPKPEDLLARIKQLKEGQKREKTQKIPPLPMDKRDFGIGAQLLHNLGIYKLKVISNSPQSSRIGITGYGLEIVEVVEY